MEFDAGVPIWSQLLDRFQRRIVSGDWTPGSQVPTVRDLAADFGVNPNTVQKALAELERTGLAETRRGLGRFVTADLSAIGRVGRELASETTNNFVSTMKSLGLGKTETVELVEKIWEP